MIALGLRAHPHQVTYAVVTAGDAPGDPPAVRATSCLRLPAALHVPEQLSFLRTTLLDLIREYGVTCAGVRVTEGTAQRPNVRRVNIEGVIQELLGAGAVPAYFAGPLGSIGKWLQLPAGQVKPCAKGKAAPDGIADWSTRFGTEEREALLAAMAALRLPRPRLTGLLSDGAVDAPALGAAVPVVIAAPAAGPRLMLVETEVRFERRGNVGVQGANSEVFEAYDQQLSMIV